ncbi:hypothetical protein GQ457_13G020480 [Hibiscus cannabinus]
MAAIDKFSPKISKAATDNPNAKRASLEFSLLVGGVMGRPPDNPRDDLELVCLEKQVSTLIPGVGAGMVGDSLGELPMADAVVETDSIIPNVVAPTTATPTISFRDMSVGANPVQSEKLHIPDFDVEVLSEDVRMRTVDGTPMINFFDRLHAQIDSKLSNSVIVQLLG